MKNIFAATLIFKMLTSNYCFAQSPVTVAMSKGPPALLEMEVHNERVHDIYLTRPASSPSYVPGHVKIIISRGVYPDFFQAELAYVELPDGRILFKVSIPPDAEADYEIRATDMTKGSTWYPLFSLA